MNGFEGMLFATILLTFLAVSSRLFTRAAVPHNLSQNIRRHTDKAIVASLIPGACAAILYATFKGLDLYLRDHLQMQRLTAMLVIVLGVVAPWCVGIYFGYRTARAANKVLRAIGSMERTDLPDRSGSTRSGLVVDATSPLHSATGPFGFTRRKGSKPKPSPAPAPRPASASLAHKSSHTRAPKHSRKNLYSCHCASAPATKSDRETPAAHA